MSPEFSGGIPPYAPMGPIGSAKGPEKGPDSASDLPPGAPTDMRTEEEKKYDAEHPKTETAAPESAKESPKPSERDKIEERIWKQAADNAKAEGEDQQAAIDKLKELETQNPAEFEKVMDQAMREVHLAVNIEKAEAEYQKKYESGPKNKIEGWLEKHPTFNKVFGFLKGGLYAAGAGAGARVAVTGLALALAAGGLAVPAIAVAAVGGAAAGGAAGLVAGWRKGKQAYESRNLAAGKLEQELNTDAVLAKDSPEATEKAWQDYKSNKPENTKSKEDFEKDHYAAYYQEVREVLAKYNALESSKDRAVFGSRAEISQFYTNKAKLEQILQTESVRQQAKERKQGEPVTNEERADMLLEALKGAEKSDQERFKNGLSEKAQAFVKDHLEKRGDMAKKAAWKGGAFGAVVGGATGALMHFFVDAHVAKTDAAGGGHWNAELAQSNAIHNDRFTDLVDQIEAGKFTGNDGATQLAYKFGLAPGEGNFQNIHNILAQAKDGGATAEQINKLAYNLLSYANHEGVGNAFWEQVGVDPIKYVDATQFRADGVIKGAAETYYHKLMAMNGISKFIDAALPTNPAVTAAIADSTAGILAGMHGGPGMNKFLNSTAASSTEAPTGEQPKSEAQPKEEKTEKKETVKKTELQIGDEIDLPIRPAKPMGNPDSRIRRSLVLRDVEYDGYHLNPKHYNPDEFNKIQAKIRELYDQNIAEQKAKNIPVADMKPLTVRVRVVKLFKSQDMDKPSIGRFEFIDERVLPKKEEVVQTSATAESPEPAKGEPVGTDEASKPKPTTLQEESSEVSDAPDTDEPLESAIEADPEDPAWKEFDPKWLINSGENQLLYNGVPVAFPEDRALERSEIENLYKTAEEQGVSVVSILLAKYDVKLIGLQDNLAVLDFSPKELEGTEPFDASKLAVEDFRLTYNGMPTEADAASAAAYDLIDSTMLDSADPNYNIGQAISERYTVEIAGINDGKVVLHIEPKPDTNDADTSNVTPNAPTGIPIAPGLEPSSQPEPQVVPQPETPQLAPNTLVIPPAPTETPDEEQTQPIQAAQAQTPQAYSPAPLPESAFWPQAPTQATQPANEIRNLEV